MKRKLALLACALLGWATPTAPAAAGPARLPHVLWNPDWDYPFWVSQEVAFTSAGKVDRKLFQPAAGKKLEELLAGKEIEGCIRVEEKPFETADPQPRGSLDAAVQSAELVVHGKVTGTGEGFDDGMPATLIRIEVLELAKGSSELEEMYFTWPLATFTAAGKKICKTDPRYAELPKPGDEAIVFVPELFPPPFEMLQLRSPGDVIFLRSDRIDYPSTMIRDPETAAENPATRSQLLRKLGFTGQGR